MIFDEKIPSLFYFILFNLDNPIETLLFFQRDLVKNAAHKVSHKTKTHNTQLIKSKSIKTLVVLQFKYTLKRHIFQILMTLLELLSVNTIEIW